MMESVEFYEIINKARLENERRKWTIMSKYEKMDVIRRDCGQFLYSFWCLNVFHADQGEFDPSDWSERYRLDPVFNHAVDKMAHYIMDRIELDRGTRP
jgi:hypothetical protein